MTKAAQKSVKYVSYLVAALVGVVLVLFGIQAKNEASNTVAGSNIPNILGETAYADHGYSQSSYYSQSTYYSEGTYYTQAYYQAAYGDAGGGGDDGDDDGI